jgi:hypothetical protein
MLIEVWPPRARWHRSRASRLRRCTPSGSPHHANGSLIRIVDIPSGDVVCSGMVFVLITAIYRDGGQATAAI